MGIALILPIMGLRAYALPAVGLAYLDGQEDAIAIFKAIFTTPIAKVIYIFLVVVYSLGSSSLASPSGALDHYVSRPR